MPFILLPPLGGIRGGACAITLNFFISPNIKKEEDSTCPTPGDH